MLLGVDVYRWQRSHRGKICRSRVSAPLGMAELACCGPRLLPGQLSVLPDGMVVEIIRPGMYTYVFWVEAVSGDRLPFLRCVVEMFRQ